MSITTVRADLAGDTCAAAGITAQCSAPILTLCRELLAAGLDPDQSVEVFRNGTLALTVRSIGEAARLRIAPHGVGFQRLAECTGAPPVRLPEAAATSAWMEAAE
jgi:hypothetical protein